MNHARTSPPTPLQFARRRATPSSCVAGKKRFTPVKRLSNCSPKLPKRTGLPADAVQLVNTTDRDAVGHFLSMNDCIDVAIPRGGEGTHPSRLGRSDHACHQTLRWKLPRLSRCGCRSRCYGSSRLPINSKTHRYGVCNAAESLSSSCRCGCRTIATRLARHLPRRGSNCVAIRVFASWFQPPSRLPKQIIVPSSSPP